MKGILVCCFLIFFAMNLFSETVGTVTFVLGEAKYKENVNSSWKDLELNAKIDASGIIKTGLDSEISITWTKSKIPQRILAERQATVQELLNQSMKSATWKEKLESKLTILVAEKKKKKDAISVAGVRRAEVKLDSDNEVSSDLYWKTEKKVSLEEALSAYEQKDFDTAVGRFYKIIEQSPLSKDAEMSRAHLVLYYSSINDTRRAKEQLQVLKADFPNSELASEIQESISELK